MKRTAFFLLFLLAAGCGYCALAPEDDPRRAPLQPPVEPRVERPKAPPVPAPVGLSEPEPAEPRLAGMVFVPGGRVAIGTEPGGIDDLLAERPPNIRRLFDHELPRHEVTLAPYLIGRYEVTNAQYRRFLGSRRVTYDTASGKLANLDDIAAHLVRLSRDQQEDPRQVVWLQLYLANKAAIATALGERMRGLQVRGPDGEVDHDGTAGKLRFEPLPRTLALQFYSLRPPANWPGMDPPAGEANHPVRYVTYDDAAAFAEWAGAHVPTEQEWEWAARGPEGPRFPWGDEWFDDTSHANWGGKVKDRHGRTTTLPVDHLPAGRSWCGGHHMTGNVAEWTSSWFEMYPGSPAGRHNQMGWVKVIRGGSAADTHVLTLRPACRNHVGAGANAPPFPENAFQWCGFRIAAFPDPARDRLGPVVRRATRPKRIRAEHLDLDGFAGAATRPWVAPEPTPAEHVYALGGAKAVLVIPMRSFLREDGLDRMRQVWKKARQLKTTDDVAKLSERDPWPIGVLHTDVTLEPVEVARPRPRRPRTRRSRPPESVAGRCPAGTYVLAIAQGRLALLEPTMELVGYVPGPEDDREPFRLLVMGGPEPRRTTLSVEAPLDWVDIRFAVALGGKGVEENLRVAFDLRLPFETGALEAAGFAAPGDTERDR